MDKMILNLYKIKYREKESKHKKDKNDEGNVGRSIIIGDYKNKNKK